MQTFSLYRKLYPVHVCMLKTFYNECVMQFTGLFWEWIVIYVFNDKLDTCNYKFDIGIQLHMLQLWMLSGLFVIYIY